MKKESNPSSCKKSTWIGESGRTFVKKLGSKINSLKDTPKKRNFESCALLLLQLEEIYLEKQIKIYCTETQLRVPQDTFVISSGLTDSAI